MRCLRQTLQLRHVSSHKRLAHAKPKPGLTSEEDQMKTILELYKRLSVQHKSASRAACGREQEPS